MKKIIEKWRCPQCGELFDDKDDATICCPQVAEQRFVCSDCGSDFWTKEQVIKHLYIKGVRAGKPGLGEWSKQLEKGNEPTAKEKE